MEKGKSAGPLYRLNVFDIRLPPLRERYEDIAQLFAYFTRECALRDGSLEPPPPPERFLQALKSHQWPGNVRELENAAEKWTVLRRLLDAEAAAALTLESLGSGSTLVVKGENWYSGSLEAITRRAALAVLSEEGGNISRAARRLGIDRQTLRKHIKDSETEL